MSSKQISIMKHNTLLIVLKKERSNQRNEHQPSRELRHKAYNTQKWRNLRLNYLREFPICQDCLERGIVKSACDVHHLKSPFNYKNNEVNEYLMYDYSNLRSLCKECHAERHNESKEKSAEEILKALDEFLKDI